MIKEIIFFSNGSADSASTWSNIPYLFTRTLEKKGIRVRKVNLCSHLHLCKCYDLFVRRIIKLIYSPLGIAPNYASHTRWYQYLGNRTIKRSVMKYHQADYCIFIYYLFYNLPEIIIL